MLKLVRNTFSILFLYRGDAIMGGYDIYIRTIIENGSKKEVVVLKYFTNGFDVEEDDDTITIRRGGKLIAMWFKSESLGIVKTPKRPRVYKTMKGWVSSLEKNFGISLNRTYRYLFALHQTAFRETGSIDLNKFKEHMRKTMEGIWK